MYRQDDGVVLHDDILCIACGRCYWACPYGEVSFSRTRGVTQKCDTCIGRREQGLAPACVEACPTLSLRFGELPGDEGDEPDLPFLPDPSITALLCACARPRHWRMNAMTEHRTKYLILGSGAAALSAAQAIRRVDAAGDRKSVV